MQKLLVLTSTFPRWQGDTEPPFVFELCKQLISSFDVYVLTPHAQGALEQESMCNIKVVRFRYFFERFQSLCYQGGILARLREQPLRYLLIPFFMGFQFLAAYRLIKDEKISLVHAHWIIPQGLIACLLRFFCHNQINILCTSHGGDLYSLKGKLFKFIKRIVLINSQAITVVNSIMAEEVYSLCNPFRPKVSVIPMGVDFQNTFRTSSARKKPFSLIFVGRLVEKKGIAYLIKALPIILQNHPNINLTIIGTGPILQDLNTLVNELQLREHVYFLGAISNSDLPKYYQKHKIAVFPFIIADNGDREGLPVVISEAIGCGCCVVTSNLPGMSDLIEHNRSGFIIEQKNHHAIAEQIINLFSNPENISNAALEAHKTITNDIDLRVIGKKYINIINKIMK